MLSEILDANGEYIQQWAMHGTQQNETAMEYPYQPRPPPRAWKIWRDAIHSTSLERHRNADSCPLYRPIGPTYVTHQCTTATLASTNTYDRHDDEGTLDLLPHAYRQAVGNVSLSSAQALKSKNMIYAWSDCAVKNGEAAHA